MPPSAGLLAGGTNTHLPQTGQDRESPIIELARTNEPAGLGKGISPASHPMLFPMVPFDLSMGSHQCIVANPLKARIPSHLWRAHGLNGLVTFAVVIAITGLFRVLHADSAAKLQGTAAKSIETFCLPCHDSESSKGGFDADALLKKPVAANAAEWERALRKISSRQMPPEGKKRPAESVYNETFRSVASILDRESEAHPDPGQSESIRRLNRTEYHNAIRDLLGLDLDVSAWLPKDESGHGFDNVTVGNLSPMLLERYMTAAQKISRLAVGSFGRDAAAEIYRVKPDITQEEQVEGLPAGTRGGTLISHFFPRDGEYEIQVRLTRDRNEEVEGLKESHEIVFLLDRKQIAGFTVSPPAGHRDYEKVDAHLKARIPVTAGPHQLGITFLKLPSSLVETKRQPYAARFNMHRHPRLGPAVYQVSVNGPFSDTGAGVTPSRQRIFICRPTEKSEEEKCANRILGNLARSAFRRPVAPEDLEGPMRFFRETCAESGFEAGIESALAAVLMSPEFLFRVEKNPRGAAPGSVNRLTDIELASRLSFFLWGSIPDDDLLKSAERHELGNAKFLEKQVKRMLADKRASHLSTSFAGQWLYLRNLESFTPNVRLFPDFDDNLRQAFRLETEAHFDAMLRENRSVLDLLQTRHTYLNERLARHYGIPNVMGSHFRKVALDPGSERGGLLRQGSILTVTSYATRTSPVVRGNWILANILGTPAPPPPANVPALKENTISATLPVRQRLTEHRANPACASCHNLMDPVGFALENYDAIGRWRLTEDGVPVDNRGGLPDGSRFNGVAGLEAAIRSRPEGFATTLTEKLMTFALGRGVGPADAPAIRKIVHDARPGDFQFNSLVLGIVKSPQFNLRKAQ